MKAEIVSLQQPLKLRPVKEKARIAFRPCQDPLPASRCCGVVSPLAHLLPRGANKGSSLFSQNQGSLTPWMNCLRRVGGARRATFCQKAH